MKRYYYKGKEISEFKANLLCIGAGVGLVLGALGLFGLMNMFLFIGAIYGM